jgi:uncharacterized membrane protein
MGYGMGGSGMWGFSFLWLLVPTVLVGGGVYLLTRRGSTRGADQPLEILREQYACGENRRRRI